MKFDFLKGKTILITGGTGSFGNAFVRFLLDNVAARKVIVFSRDEFKQFQMQKEINDERLNFFLGDIRDLKRLERAFRTVDVVVHAAALKQVPTLEYNPFEAVQTNITGSQNVIDAAIDQGVKKVLLLSTDKAAQPSNLYGATKLCAEKLFINGNFFSTGETVLSAVRYGNVIGSRGSIVEALRNNKDAKTVDITHPNMTRFWLNLRQSFMLVLFALSTMRGGEIFVPKIPSMKVVDLFDVLAPHAAKKIIGIRPGEKLHEVLLTKEEARHALEFENHFVILSEFPFQKGIYDKYHTTGKKLPDEFSFTSDTNKNWFTREQLIDAIEAV